jgi:c-di-GMP-binding flagellar brake protein YcgR
MVFPKDNFPNNKRFFNRLDNKLNLKYQVVKSPQKISLEKTSPEQFSILKNISAGGILFLAFQEFPVGTILHINLELLDNEEPIKCLVKVMRIKGIEQNKTYEVGACFMDLSNRERNRLSKYVTGEW